MEGKVNVGFMLDFICEFFWFKYDIFWEILLLWVCLVVWGGMVYCMEICFILLCEDVGGNFILYNCVYLDGVLMFLDGEREFFEFMVVD